LRERIVKTTILLRRGTLAEFTEHNPLLKYGEPSFVVDLNRLKIGDGIHCWIDLPYIGGESNTVRSYESRADLPETGTVGSLYYIIDDNDLLSWDAENNEYVSVMQSKFDEMLNNVHISKLLQDADEYVWFDCGTSTETVW